MSEIDPKFNDINKIVPSDPVRKTRKPAHNRDSGFDKIFIDRLDKDRTQDPVGKTGSLSEIQGSFRAQNLDPVTDQPHFSRKLSESLNLLDTYASWLKDPEKTLKQLHTLLEELSGHSKALEQDFKSNAVSDTDLNQILNRLITMVEVEQIKLNRGDYLG